MEELRKFGVKRVELSAPTPEVSGMGATSIWWWEFEEGEATLDNFLGLAGTWRACWAGGWT